MWKNQVGCSLRVAPERLMRSRACRGERITHTVMLWLGAWALASMMAGCGVKFNVLPTVSLSPSTIAWHKVNIGNTSGAKTITVTNTSEADAIPLAISAINLSANFIETASTCPIAPKLLAPGASCTISVAFRPQTSGPLTGTLTLTDNVMGTPASVSLSAPGGIGFLLFDPTSLDFPGVAANTVSQPQTATLTNKANTPVTIAKFTTSSHFAEGDNCPISPNTLPPGGSCSVTVTSNPVAAGAISGAVNVEDEFGNVTQLYLTGSDQGRQNVGALNFTPSNLLWGKVGVGQTSATKTVTVNNTQSSSVSFSNIATGPDYTITASTCPLAPATLGGGQSCTVSVAFRPTKADSITELLTFSDTALGSSQAISLKGTGVLGDVLFTPTSLSFAGVDPGQQSPVQEATLTNETGAGVDITSITVSGHFAQSNNCSSTLAPQASCTFQVTANPTAEGAMTGSINVKDGAGNSAQLYLKGEGGNTDKILSFDPNPLVWGTIDVGQTSGSKVLTVNNGQTVPLTIYSISVGADFIATDSQCPTAPATVAAGSSCTISLAFRPYSTGAKSEVITFTDDAPGGNQSVSLMGTGAAGSLAFNPTSLTFAGVDPNSVSQPQTARLTNEQTTAINLSSITISGHFAETDDCPGSLAPNASCTFTVTSNPVIEGPIEGSINVKDGSGVTTQLYLSGMGGVPIDDSGSATGEVVVLPSSLHLGSVMVGQTSTASQLILSNNHPSPVTISQMASGPDIHVEANTCPVAPRSLAAGAACKILVAFRPESAGVKNEGINFKTGKSTEPHSVVVDGTGRKGTLSFSTGSLTFASLSPGVQTSAQAATLVNQDSVPVRLRKIQVIGPFSETNDCPAATEVLAPGASCTIVVRTESAFDGVSAGTINVVDSSGAVTQLYLARETSNPSQR